MVTCLQSENNKTQLPFVRYYPKKPIQAAGKNKYILQERQWTYRILIIPLPPPSRALSRELPELEKTLQGSQVVGSGLVCLFKPQYR